MNPVRIPLAPKCNLISGTAACPNGGFLYIGYKSVNYISAVENDEAPIIKTISMRQKIQSIGCDSDWSETKYFAALADDNTIQVWDVEDSKAKKGHKAHIKTPIGDGDEPTSDLVAMCFLRNRTILSIDSNAIVKYCIKSNRYAKTKRIVNSKHRIIIAKGSSHDENLIAFGSTRGLVFLVNLSSESIVSTFCGHTREVTSFSWITISSPAAASRPIKKSSRKLNRKEYTIHNATADDVFDIYDYDYLENEFGAPARENSKVASDAGSTGNSNPRDEASNEHFNFIEACRNLKDDILARNQDEDCKDDSRLVQSTQVTLEDCQQAIQDREISGEDQSFECDSEMSVEFLGSSEDSLRDNFQNSCTLNSTTNQSMLEEGRVGKVDVYLASGSTDGTVWVWDVNTGSSVDQITTKSSHGQANNNYVEVCWLNSNTLIMNDKLCELAFYTSDLAVDKKAKFKREKVESMHRGVLGLCKMINSSIVWTLSSRRELICEDVVSKQILAQYSCGIAGVSAICENPGDMNRVAIAFPDRRVGLVSLAAITPKNIPIEYWMLKEDSQIHALCWGPTHRHLAFGTGEGCVGVIDTEKPGSAIVLMKPFSGKPIYSVSWCDDKIFACSQEKIAYYQWNGKSQHATKLENITRASSVTMHDNLMLVGNQLGDVILHVRSDRNQAAVTYEPVSFKNIFPKYIKDIEFSPVNPCLVAVSAMSSNVVILKLVDLTIELVRTLIANEKQSSAGNSNINSIKWSNKNENLLLTCGLDGTIRIWDLSRPSGDELIFLKYFDSPMLCGVFCAINENVIICAGRATSIEMFNYLEETTESVKKISKEKKKDKHLGEVQWGTRLENAVSAKKKSKQPKHIEVDGDFDPMIEKLKQHTGDEEGPIAEKRLVSNAAFNSSHPPTVLHLLAKELNKDTLQNLSKVLEDPLESSLMSQKLFGSAKDAEDILKAELDNHEKSRTNSIGRVLIPQITGDLKEEILECIRSKKLNEFHVSLAPTISYEFWKSCCKAYANQLIEVGLALNATSYLLACHEVRESIEHLIDKHYYREAWIIGKVHLVSGDPIFDIVLQKWVQHVSSTGNYEGAALLSTLAGDFKGALKSLSERRQQSDEHHKIVAILKGKVPS